MFIADDKCCLVFDHYKFNFLLILLDFPDAAFLVGRRTGPRHLARGNTNIECPTCRHQERVLPDVLRPSAISREDELSIVRCQKITDVYL